MSKLILKPDKDVFNNMKCSILKPNNSEKKSKASNLNNLSEFLEKIYLIYEVNSIDIKYFKNLYYYLTDTENKDVKYMISTDITFNDLIIHIFSKVKNRLPEKLKYDIEMYLQNIEECSDYSNKDYISKDYNKHLYDMQRIYDNLDINILGNDSLVSNSNTNFNTINNNKWNNNNKNHKNNFNDDDNDNNYDDDDEFEDIPL